MRCPIEARKIWELTVSRSSSKAGESNEPELVSRNVRSSVAAVSARTVDRDKNVADCCDKHMCTFACDFLFGLPTPWDIQTRRQMHACFRKCGNLLEVEDSCSEKSSNDALIIDLRGLYVHEAVESLINSLNFLSGRRGNKQKGEFSPTKERCAHVVVGCKVHGCGKGKLKKEITRLLVMDGIGWRDLNEVISIKVEDKRDYTSLGWDFVKCMEFHTMKECDTMKSVSEAMKSDEVVISYDKDGKLIFKKKKWNHGKN